MSLVEVVAATAVMGTLLVLMLSASAGLIRQAAKAKQALEACRLADEFIDAAWQDRSRFPIDREGDLAGHPGWRWRTYVVRSNDPILADLRIRRVAVEMFSPAAAAERSPLAGQEADRAADACIEVLLDGGPGPASGPASQP